MSNNILEKGKVNSMIWKLGLPMILSMVLQALYNVVDTAFVINMGSDGPAANLALTYAFPVQIFMIAIGVGTGVGINAMLSRSLGEGDREKASCVAGNGIFIGIVVCLAFVLFGVFGAEPFTRMQAKGNEDVIRMGTAYLRIVCVVSVGSIGFAVTERFLQATGRTMYSTIGQISGALANIVLDYAFIYPLDMGIEGAAWATVIGQCLSLAVTMLLHIFKNPEIDKSPCYIRPRLSIIKGIYHIGLSAMLMQGLLSCMMLGVNLILGLSSDYAVLQGTFGIYYKIQQMALFACFGLSNTLITAVSFNYGMKNKSRLRQIVRVGIVDSAIVSGTILVLFEVLAYPISYLFGMSSGEVSGDIVGTCTLAIRIGAAGYVFMGVTVGIQGILQGLRKAATPLLLSFFRLALFVFPCTYLLVLTPNPRTLVWLAFPISEALTVVFALIFMRRTLRSDIEAIEEISPRSEGLAICISRTHGALGRVIGSRLAERLGVPYYDKDIASMTAQTTGLSKAYIGDLDENGARHYELYLSLEVNNEAIIAQSEVIRRIADKGDCVIVGRGASAVLTGRRVFSVFLDAPMETRIARVMEMYGDSREDAERHIKQSDSARRAYYEKVTGTPWGTGCDLSVNTAIGVEEAVDAIISSCGKAVQGRDK